MYKNFFNLFNNISTVPFAIVSSILYLLIHIFLHKVLLLNNNYKKIKYKRKTYILTNISKSIVLSVICFMFLTAIKKNDINLLNTINWDKNNQVLINFTTLYSITDIIGLFINKKMMLSTIIHHICVFFGWLYVINSDFSKEGLFKPLIIYGCFSSTAFIINLYLGSRFIIPIFLKNILKKICYYNYLISITFNWLWQIFYLTIYIYLNCNNVYSMIAICLYIILLYNWVKDDLILIKYLKE